MNTPRRPRYAAALFGAATLAASALTLLPGAARAQTATAVTDPVGYLSIALPANSDTFVSIPFTRPAEFTGAVASVSTSGTAPNTVGTITLSGTPGFTSGAFAPLATTAPNDGHKTYYAIIGPKNAALTPTLSVTNGSATVTASAAPEAVAGDTITVAGYTFTVVSVSGTTLTIDRVYPDATSATGLAATYDHSPSEGRFYTVSTNDTGSLTVNLNGDNLSNVVAGTQVSVIPYWTLGTVFPATDAGTSFTATAANVVGTHILTPNLSGQGINLAPKANFFFANSSWRQLGKPPTGVYDDQILTPDAYFIVRNDQAPSGSLVTTGSVLVNRLSAPLATQASTQQDNLLADLRPVDVTLNDLGLINSGAFTPTSANGPGDQLLILNNVKTGLNKAPSGTFIYANNGWRQLGKPPTTDYGTTVITSATGLIVRKAVGNGSTVFWQNSRNFLN